MNEQLPPAGWHPDPEQPGTWRYWDGTQWTDQRAPMAPAAQERRGDDPVAAILVGIVGCFALLIFLWQVGLFS